MTEMEIRNEIDWLLDDNHRCVQIMSAENSSAHDISEAQMRLDENKAKIRDLTERLNHVAY